MRTPSPDPRVRAIRDNPKVGAGSCTSIDECFDDKDLIEALDSDEITDPAEAVKWALQHEGLFLEQALNARWGEDDDPQLTAWKEWNENKDEEKS